MDGWIMHLRGVTATQGSKLEVLLWYVLHEHRFAHAALRGFFSDLDHSYACLEVSKSQYRRSDSLECCNL